MTGRRTSEVTHPGPGRRRLTFRQTCTGAGLPVLRVCTCIGATLLLTSIWIGCSNARVGVRFEATRAGSFMTRMRDRQGGLEAWRRSAGVTFSYRATFRGKVETFDRMGFRFDHFKHLWVQRTAASEVVLVSLSEAGQPLRGRPLEALRGAARGAAPPTPALHRKGFDGPIRRQWPPEAPEIDFGLRAAHFLFAPCLTTTAGEWSYRTLLASPDVPLTDHRVEISAAPPYVPEGFYLLEEDPQSGALARILYRGTHPLIVGRTQMVSFEDSIRVGGIEIARRRRHRRPIEASDERVLTENPFLPRSRVREEEFLVEELDHIEFIDEKDVDALLPLPEENADLPASGALSAAR